MTFKCLKCGKEVDKIIDRVRCPFCGYRIFSKKRPKVVKKVKSQ